LAFVGFPWLLGAPKAKESQGAAAKSQGETLAFVGFPWLFSAARLWSTTSAAQQRHGLQDVNRAKEALRTSARGQRLRHRARDLSIHLSK
jgi:hypothetical protein